MSPPKHTILHDPVQPDLFQEYVVVSSHMKAVMQQAHRIARYDASVLIYGESGTGKELLARMIHQASHRRDKPFVPMNCGTLSGDLFESRLFGHEVGAFTGASRLMKGRFELAHQGTLFLDEVSEISLQNQVNFLRVLEDGWFYRIGGEKPIRSDVRIIAATNKDLAAEVQAGRFRHDLFYRLQVIPFTLLPLRDRREVISPLVNHFMERFAAIYKKEPIRITDRAMDCLKTAQWPGNIRQLKNLLERLFLTVPKPIIDVDDLPPEFLEPLPKSMESAANDSVVKETPLDGILPAGVVEPLWKARRRVEQELILRALNATAGHRIEAARLLEIKPRTLRQTMSEYGIKFSKKRSGSTAEKGN